MALNSDNNGSTTTARDIFGDLINNHRSENINLYIPQPAKSDNLWELIKREVDILTGNSKHRTLTAAVKSLGEKIQLQLEKDNRQLHYVIYNLSQDYFKSLHGHTEYQEHYIHDILFGVWIFEYGQFENLGFGTYENWTFGGYNGGNWTRSGEPIKLFRDPWRPWDFNYGGGRKVTFSKISEANKDD